MADARRSGRDQQLKLEALGVLGSGLLVALAAVELAALLLLLARLARGYHRPLPVLPVSDGIADTTVEVLLPTRNERRRLGPCLASLLRQGSPLTAVIAVDSDSTDGTRAMLHAAAANDQRLRVVSDPPVPVGWVGKAWALECGRQLATADWVLGVDADVELEPGAVAGAVNAARERGLDVVSFSPRFADQTAGEQWLQPSMLLSLVYRFGPPSDAPTPSQVMANGQFFLCRRRTLAQHGGFAPARASWAEDVTLARFLASRGVRVGFLEGSRLFRVRSYESLSQLWREWGRSFDLRDASSAPRHWCDVLFIVAVQGIPLPVVAALVAGALPAVAGRSLLLATAAALVAIRCLMLGAIASAYDRRSLGFWLSPLSDPVAALRLVVSSVHRPAQWRGRRFELSVPR